jgi:hypothetical protein
MYAAPSFHPGTPAQRPAQASSALRLGDGVVALDRGGVIVATWPDRRTRSQELARLAAREAPVVRLAGGALIGDLSVADNLMLEPALLDGSRPVHLLPEIDALFRDAGLPVDWAAGSGTPAGAATQAARLQARVARALVADPDVLVVDADDWDDALLPPAAFTAAFRTRFPWRALVWATADTGRAAGLRARLPTGRNDILPSQEPA